MERGTSIPTASRTAATNSSSKAMPLSVTSIPSSGCGINSMSHLSRSERTVTVPGMSETRSTPRSILSQVSPLTSLRSFILWA